MSTAIHDASAVQSILDLKEALDALPSSSRLSEADTDAIYTLAHQFVMQGRYETAYRYFSLLTLYKPTHVAYLQGLALCYRKLERYDEALNVYSFLAIIDFGNLAHSLAIIDCLLLKREFTEAKQNVELVLQYCKENAVSNKYSERAEALTELLHAPPPGAIPADA